MAGPRAAGPRRFDELLVHRFASRGTYSVSRWDGMAALGWAAPATGGAAVGSLWTTRVLCDGIAALGWQQCACWRRAGPMIDHLPWKLRVLRKKKGFLRPGVRAAATELSIAAPYPTSGAIVGKPESGEWVRVAL